MLNMTFGCGNIENNNIENNAFGFTSNIPESELQNILSFDNQENKNKENENIDFAIEFANNNFEMKKRKIIYSKKPNINYIAYKFYINKFKKYQKLKLRFYLIRLKLCFKQFH